MSSFHCHDCGQTKQHPDDSISTGYGCCTVDGVEVKVCFACCGERDRKDMLATGRAVLYLTHPKIENGQCADGKVSNWPGSLSFSCRVRRGRHNIAGSRYDVWFNGPDGREWHGIQYGEFSQLTHCRLLGTSRVRRAV